MLKCLILYLKLCMKERQSSQNAVSSLSLQQKSAYDLLREKTLARQRTLTLYMVQQATAALLPSPIRFFFYFTC